MIDAYQATLIAYRTDNGEVMHYDCAPIRGTSDDYRVNDKIMEELGYHGLIRYSIHEWEGSLWGDLEYSSDLDLSEWKGEDFGPDKDTDYSEGTIRIGDEWYDVAPYVHVMCDVCGLRIS